MPSTKRPDLYDYIGMGLVGLLAVIWVLHFVLPAPPLEPDPSLPAGLPTLPGGGIGKPF